MVVEFFDTEPNGYEGTDTKTLQENIFEKRARLIAALQDGAFANEEYQAWRNELADICHKQVVELNYELIAVRLKKKYVEKYKQENAFQYLSESDLREILKEIAPIITMNDTDEAAKRFDNFIYGMMLSHMEALPGFRYARRQLCDIAFALEKKISIPQIKQKLSLIKEINTDAFWDANNILEFENVRKELRELMKFLAL